MPDDANILEIKQVIYAGNLDVRHAVGAVLIGKLPGGPLRYLHSLFPPFDGIVDEIQNILSFPVPESYAKFFSLSDGATLFDNTLFVYGARGATTRDISVDNIRPISLAEQVALCNEISPGRDWIEVGSLAAATKNYILEIDQTGITALRSPNGERQEYPTFLQMIVTLVRILQNHCGPQGLLDSTAETLQTEIDRFIRATRQ